MLWEGAGWGLSAGGAHGPHPACGRAQILGGAPSRAAEPHGRVPGAAPHPARHRVTTAEPKAFASRSPRLAPEGVPGDTRGGHSEG